MLGSCRLMVVDMVAVPVATVVLVARQCVEAFLGSDHLTHLYHQHPGSLTVGQQDREASVLLTQELQLSQLRALVDHQLVPHRHRQGDHLPPPGP